MPNIATQLYHKNPGLQVLLDFLGRCEPDGRRLAAHYQEAHEADAVKAACASSGIHPVETVPAPGRGNGYGQTGLALDQADWLSLARNALPLLAQQLRLRLPAITAALKLVPVPWDALALPDGALRRWGAAAGMVALPKQAVFAYLGSRYPADAEQRGRYAVIRDVEQAAAYKKNNALGFVVNKDDAQSFACHADDWSREVASAAALVDHHLALMLKIGLQTLDAGVADPLKDLRSVLLLAGDAPCIVRLHTLLETYEDHLAACGADRHGFRDRLLKNCRIEFAQWQADRRLGTGHGSSVAYLRGPTGSARVGEWKDTGASSRGAARVPGPASALPAPASDACRSGAAPAPAPGAERPVPKADPVIAEGVIIPKGVMVARGAHVRVCEISGNTRLKPGSVLHGDVSIASHTRFDGPVTIMNDVRIGWGLSFGQGLILGEGATISTFAVRSALPPAPVSGEIFALARTRLSAGRCRSARKTG